jgi:uncharacterized membrane protein
MSRPDDDRVALYLAQLQDELRNVDARVRDRVVREIALEIRDARSGGASVDRILGDIGDPLDIAANVREHHGVRTRSRWREIAAVVLVLFGGVVIPVAGWFVGLYYLWSSPVWTVRLKTFATLCLPGGALVPLLLVGRQPLFALLLLLPAATAALLTVSAARAGSL